MSTHLLTQVTGRARDCSCRYFLVRKSLGHNVIATRSSAGTPRDRLHSSSLCAMIEVVHADDPTVDHTTNCVALALMPASSDG